MASMGGKEEGKDLGKGGRMSRDGAVPHPKREDAVRTRLEYPPAWFVCPAMKILNNNPAGDVLAEPLLVRELATLTAREILGSARRWCEALGPVVDKLLEMQETREIMIRLARERRVGSLSTTEELKHD